MLVQESQLEKFCQDLTAMTVAANFAHTLTHSRGRGGSFRGCGQRRGRTDNHTTCQLSSKYGHDALTCWHHFDKSFTTPAEQEPTKITKDKCEASAS